MGLLPRHSKEWQITLKKRNYYKVKCTVLAAKIAPLCDVWDVFME